ncbi:MAG: holin family protein [Oscillospiraceae bacterium]
MHDKMIAVCSILGVVGAAIAEAFGGWDDAIIALIIFMAIDFIMGLLCALVFGKSDKSDNGALSSAACWRGLVKKVCTLLMVVMSHYIDVIADLSFVRNAVVIAFCVAEAISICETAGLMGILPEGVQRVLTKAIDVLKNKGDK